MAAKRSKAEYHASTLMQAARQYERAANRLIAAVPQRDLFDDYPLPVLFLLHHCVELALKAYLRAHAVPIAGVREHHRIVEL